MGKKKRKQKIKYGKTKGTVPPPIVFSQTNRGMKATARRRLRQAMKPKEQIESREAEKPIMPRETIEPVSVVELKEPVPAIYEPEDVETEVQSITDEAIETLEKELVIEEPPDYGLLELGVKKFAKESGLDEKEAADRMAYMIKDELKKLIDEGDREKTISFLDMLRKKSLYDVSTIFNLGKKDASNLTSSMMDERFFILIDPNLTVREVVEKSGLGMNRVMSYRTALKALGPEIARYRTRSTPIEEMSGLYDCILDFIEKNKDGVTPTDIDDYCGKAYGMPTSRKSDKKWKILDETARIEQDGKAIFRDGKYFPCQE